MDKPQSSVKPNLYPTLFVFLIPSVILCVLILLYSNTRVFIYINNQYHSALLDTLMPYITMLGEWFLILPIIVAMAFVDYKRALGTTLAGAFAFIIVQSLKTFAFAEVARPAGIFSNDLSVLHIVENTDLHSMYSFPSGHTAGGFMWCSSVAFFFNKKYISFILLVVACFIGWSRIYLAQHFPSDVAVGAVIGVASSAIIEIWISKTPKFAGGDNFMTLFRKK